MLCYIPSRCSRSSRTRTSTRPATPPPATSTTRPRSRRPSATCSAPGPSSCPTATSTPLPTTSPETAASFRSSWRRSLKPLAAWPQQPPLEALRPKSRLSCRPLAFVATRVLSHCGSWAPSLFSASFSGSHVGAKLALYFPKEVNHFLAVKEEIEWVRAEKRRGEGRLTENHKFTYKYLYRNLTLYCLSFYSFSYYFLFYRMFVVCLLLHFVYVVCNW